MLKKIFVNLLILVCLVGSINYTDTLDNKSHDLEEVLDSLQEFYDDKEKWSFREVMGYSYLKDDWDKSDYEDFQEKFEISDDEKASTYATNILGIVAIGKDPYDYNGKDHVEKLVDTQNKDGAFEIVKGDRHPATMAWSLYALDLVDASYDKEDAAEFLLDEMDKSGKIRDIDTTAMVLTALSRHKSIDSVEDAIDKGLDFIKDSQQENGGFKAWGSNNPYTNCMVIQCLVANNEKVNSAKWSENNNTVLDALMEFYDDDKFIFKTEHGKEINLISSQAFMALGSIYREESIFYGLEIKDFEYDEDEEEEDVEEKNIFNLEILDDESYDNGEEGTIEVLFENISDDKQSAVFIIALYDTDDDIMVNYSYIEKEMESSDSLKMAGGFFIPERGDYELKVFVWEDFDSRKVLLTEPYSVEVD